MLVMTVNHTFDVKNKSYQHQICSKYSIHNWEFIFKV